MDDLFAGTTLPEVEFSFDLADGAGALWRPVHVHVREALSQLYECSAVLATRALSASLEDLFEKPAGVEITRSTVARNVRGLVRRVEDLGTTGSYRFARVVIVPALWHLSHRKNSRIFQHVNVATIVREVLKDAGLYQGDGAFVVSPGVAALPPREYCVQYRETDLDFVRRLLEEEGVPFYFRHDGAAETFVLADENHAWQPVPTMDNGAVRVRDAGIGTASTETVQWFDWHHQSRPTGVVLRDYDFTHPRAVLDMSPKHPADPGSRVVYEYSAGFTLGEYDEGSHAYKAHHGTQWSRVRAEQLRAEARVGVGRSNVTGMTPGLRFKVEGHSHAEHDREFVVTSVEQQGVAWGDVTDDVRRSEHIKSIFRELGADFEGGAHGDVPPQARYWNRFQCVPSDVPWRPERATPKPNVGGPQTAVVMARPGSNDEICVDRHGRVLIRFHWERPELRTTTQTSQNSSCWVRVAQSWAGAAWGSMFIPRVGMEVVVVFIEGDPDRPLVTGCVYNGENHTPYLLPDEKTKSTIKTSSTPGGQGFNELRFEDLKDEEQIYVHAQRDMDVMVRHDATATVGNDRTHTIQGHEHLTVRKDRVSSIQRNDSLDVEGNRTVGVHGGVGLSVNVDAVYALKADAKIVLTCGESVIEMLPDRITVGSTTVNVVGTRVVNINGTLVKINCDAAPVAKGEAGATLATRALSLQGSPGGLLKQALSLVNPAKLGEFFTKGLDKLLEKIGVPQRIRDRLGGLASNVVGELFTALKEGRAPAWGKLAEGAIGAAIGMAVGEVFRPLANLDAVKKSRILSGLVKEAQGFATDAATYGVLHAAGLNEGMAKDPFWQVMKERHAGPLKELLTDVAKDAGKQLLNGLMQRHGRTPAAPQQGLMTLATDQGVIAGMAAGAAPGGPFGGGAKGASLRV